MTGTTDRRRAGTTASRGGIGAITHADGAGTTRSDGGKPSPPRPDLRLVLPALAAWLAAVAAVGLDPGHALLSAAAAAAVGGAVLVSVRRASWAPLAAAVLICGCGAIAATGLHGAARREGPLLALGQQRAAVTLEVRLTDDPRRVAVPAGLVPGQRDLFVVPVRAERVDSGGSVVRVRTPLVVLSDDAAWAGLLPSQRVRVEGRLGPPRPGDEAAAALSARGPPQVLSRPSLPQRVAGRLRAGLRESVRSLPRDERGLLPGLVVGDTSALPETLREDFRATGMSHLVAVSGTNVAIVLAAALLAARSLRAGPRLAPVLAGMALLAFVVLARPSPSVLRAGAMGLVAVLAVASGRQRAALPALCAAVLGLVLFSPGLSRSPGFALSVLATGGLLVLAPGWRDVLARRLPRPVAEALAVPLAAQVACAPMVAALSAAVSLVAVPANLLAVPAVAPATVLGVLAALAQPVCPPLAELAARLAGVPATWLVELAHRGAALPGGSVPWPGGTSGALVLALATAAALGLAPLRVARRAGCALLVGGLTATLVLHVARPSWPPPGWIAVVCDVGQGDAVVLAAGTGVAVVVDVGPAPAAVDRCLRDLGVRDVALVVLSHLHADHVDGLAGVLRGRRVAAVAVGPQPDTSPALAAVRDLVQPAGAQLLATSTGEVRSLADLRLEVLAPSRPFRGTDADVNNSSLVLRAESRGVSLLLTGDVEPEAQSALLAAGVDVRADVVKVPHHGSDSQDPGFLTAVGARAAIASLGADNRYQHPSARTIDHLQRSGAATWRTDLDGDVAVVATATGAAVVARSRSD